MAKKHQKSLLEQVLEYLRNVPRGTISMKIDEVHQALPRAASRDALPSDQVSGWAAANGLKLTVVGEKYRFEKCLKA